MKTRNSSPNSATRPLTPEEKRQESIVSALYTKSLKIYAPIFKEWVAAIRQELKAGNKNPSLKTLRMEKFAGLVQRLSYLSNLSGQADLRDEFNALEGRFRKDAPPPGLPPWLELSFSEAIEYFKSKQIVPNANYAALTEGYHSWAFSVAGVTREDILKDVKELLEIALEEGESLEDFESQLETLMEGRGWGPAPGSRRSYLIFDTNIRGAIGTGRGQQMRALADENPGRDYVVAWRWRDSPEPRKHHQALHNKAIPIDHPFWEKCRTPAGFGCRCSAQLMRPSIAKRLDIEILPPNKVPNPKSIADPGFRYPLWGGGEEAKKAFLEGRNEQSPETT